MPPGRKRTTLRRALRRTSPAVLLGLEVPAVGDEEAYAERIDRLSGDLPVVFFVKNSSLFVGDLLDAAEAVIEDRGNDEQDSVSRAAHDKKPLPD